MAHAVPGGLVLVADGHALTREILINALRRARLPAVYASSSEETVELVARYPISVVFLDADLPGALQTLRVVRNFPMAQTLPVVLMAPGTGLSARVAGLEAGASDYLAKPVTATEVVAKARAALRTRSAWLAALEAEVRDRGALTGLLRSVRVEATPELTAAGLCRQLTRVCGMASAVVVAFAAEGDALPLAMSGPIAAPPGWPLPRHIANSLLTNAEDGPWVRSQDEGCPLAHPAADYAAYAPLQSGGTLVGLLVVAAHGAPEADPSSARVRHLSVTVDLAAVASALLGSALEEWGLTCSARAELEWVLGGGAFRPVFQPIHDVETGEVTGYEALTRFADGAPAEPRFAEAVQVGLGLEIEAVTVAAAIHGSTPLPDDAWLSLNVSPAFLLQGEYLLRAIKCSPRPLVLELTEHDPIDDYPAIRTAVDRLGSSIQLSIDDAGTGYACLNHVLSLRPDFVKLDRSWVHGIDTDPARQALVAGVQHFTSHLGSAVIAEGVETADELSIISALHVPLAQGYLLGPPVPIGT